MIGCYPPTLDLLVQDGLLTQEEADLCVLDLRGGASSLRSVLVKRGLLASETFSSIVAFRARAAVVDMGRITGPLPAAPALPREAAVRLRALVIDQDADSARVVMDDPSDGEAVAEISRLLGKRLRLSVAARGLEAADIARYY
jgi:hypothetical protein